MGRTPDAGREDSSSAVTHLGLQQPQMRMRDTWWEGWLKKGVSFSMTFDTAFPMHPKNENWSFNVIKNLLYSVDPKSYLLEDGACQWYHCSQEGMKAPLAALSCTSITQKVIKYIAQTYRTAQCLKLSVIPQCGLGWSDLDLRGEDEGSSG